MRALDISNKSDLVLDKNLLQVVSTHPVHILNKEGGLSPSSFVPFCFFGKNLTLVGKKVDGFENPICNIFTPKNTNNQLCYEANLEKYKDNNNIEKQLTMGLTLILDYNEDRQISTYLDTAVKSISSSRIYDNDDDDDDAKALIHLDTISKVN